MSTPETRDKWLELRKRGIGGSDASAVIGCNPWKSNQQLFDEKTGATSEKSVSNVDAVRYGIDAEAPLRALFALDFPRYGVLHEEFTIYRHPEHPFLLGTFDGILTDGKTGEKGILEIKTTEIMRSSDYEKWDGKIPQNYFVQILHYLLISGFSFAVMVAQLKTGWQNDIRKTTRHYFINRDDFEDDIQYLRKAEIEFWQNNVLKGVRPSLTLPQI